MTKRRVLEKNGVYQTHCILTNKTSKQQIYNNLKTLHTK